jgi:hypothetical protein
MHRERFTVQVDACFALFDHAIQVNSSLSKYRVCRLVSGSLQRQRHRPRKIIFAKGQQRQVKTVKRILRYGEAGTGVTLREVDVP